jgi:hypothetical protein
MLNAFFYLCHKKFSRKKPEYLTRRFTAGYLKEIVTTDFTDSTDFLLLYLARRFTAGC